MYYVSRRVKLFWKVRALSIRSQADAVGIGMAPHHDQFEGPSMGIDNVLHICRTR